MSNALVDAGFFVQQLQGTPDFFRAMVSDGTTRVQMDVAPDSPQVVAPVRSPLGVYVHDLRDIAANKISAYENRVEVKDAVDLSFSLLWDTPFENRTINDRIRPVLARRAKKLPLPQRIALLDAIQAS